MQKMLLINPEKCSGCKICESVCALHHERVLNPSRSRIRIVKWETSGLYVPVVCQQCETALCEVVCPMRAIERDKQTGAVLIDHEACVGCKLCLTYCPFGGVSLDPQTRRILKCDLCNGKPLCVESCESQALEFLSSSSANLRKRRAAAERFSDLMKRMVASS